MRRFVISSCLGLCLTAMAATQLFAQEPDVRTPDRVTKLHTSYSHQLIHQRALESARQRVARIETRAWLGQSMARPTFGPGDNSADMFQRFERGGSTRYLIGRTSWYGPVITE
ncbi:MAG: hypothetical protein WD648_12535 [Planctomycetaceae bacterium]